jgi:hypothetical protein
LKQELHVKQSLDTKKGREEQKEGAEGDRIAAGLRS